MPTLTIRNIDPELHIFLRQQAAGNGRSMEAEIRALLADEMRRNTAKPGAIARAIQQRFSEIGGASELIQPQRPATMGPLDVFE